jgi:protoporphyrin/coproporphyrin ferrochelatase
VSQPSDPIPEADSEATELPRLTAERNPTSERSGVLLINLGTPDAPSVSAVRRYLHEFLSDPRVLDMTAWKRWLLLYGVVLPVRPYRSARAYRKVWTDLGSPLLMHSRAFAESLRDVLGPGFAVEVGMTYGQPSIERALDRLVAASVSRIVVFPLFPQFAASSTGAALDVTYRAAAKRWNVPALSVVPPFYADPGFVAGLADVARPVLAASRPDHVLLSYHGLPERQIRRSDDSGRYCLASTTCCDTMGRTNRLCYRAHCFETSRELARALDLDPAAYSVSFQSRLGPTPWVRPFTDEVLPELARKGVRKLAIMCPSFVADCLETLEEIVIRGAEQWKECGGKELIPIPCPNAHASWVTAAASLVRRQLGAEQDA